MCFPNPGGPVLEKATQGKPLLSDREAPATIYLSFSLYCTEASGSNLCIPSNISMEGDMETQPNWPPHASHNVPRACPFCTPIPQLLQQCPPAKPPSGHFHRPHHVLFIFTPQRALPELCQPRCSKILTLNTQLRRRMTNQTSL